MHAMCYECTNEHLDKSQKRSVYIRVSIKKKYARKLSRFAQLHPIGDYTASWLSKLRRNVWGSSIYKKDKNFRVDNVYASWMYRTSEKFYETVSTLLSFYVQSLRRDVVFCTVQFFSLS